MSVATTRPETILGDAAVAVHPGDERYRGIVGRAALLPVLGRRIPIVEDSFVDPAFGTGAVKVTPAHDPNDFMAGKRLGLQPIVVMDEQARMNDAAGPYAGLDRFECRARLVERLRSDGLLEEEKEHQLSVGRCQRCDTIVEPMISLQWFVRIEPLARPALAAVEDGRIAFIPDQWRKTYYEWMRNIRDWCISRQLWWGHRIPAWYCADCGTTLVAKEEPGACDKCGGRRLSQDPDILDTWFSSALWAFSTLGWPDQTPELRRYYPTTVLVTGYDIIFFWVARMVMMGLKFMDDVPFRAVFYNGLVRDANGEKISKTKGNAIDFFGLLDTYGTDAVRFTYAALSPPGADVILSPGRLDGSRAFANKIWNAVRFARPHLEAPCQRALPDPKGLSDVDRWMLSRSSRVSGEVSQALEAFRFDEAADRVYHFAWHEMCDWYLELAKPALLSREGPEREATRAVLGHVIDTLLRLLHPFMPFLTEELWQNLPRPAGAPISIALAEFPRRRPELEDDEAERSMGVLMENVTTPRNLSAEHGRPSLTGATIIIRPLDEISGRYLARHQPSIKALTRATVIIDTVSPAAKPGWVEVRGVTSSSEIVVAYHGTGDPEAERARLRKEIDRLSTELAVHDAKLSNNDFLSRARPEAVSKVRLAHREVSDRLSRLRQSLDRIGS